MSLNNSTRAIFLSTYFYMDIRHGQFLDKMQTGDIHSFSGRTTSGRGGEQTNLLGHTQKNNN